MKYLEEEKDYSKRLEPFDVSQILKNQVKIMKYLEGEKDYSKRLEPFDVSQILKKSG